MKKRWHGALLPIMLLLLTMLSGCGSAETEQTGQTEQEEPAVVSLRESGLAAETVYLNGRAYSGQVLGEGLLAEAGDLTEGFPDLVWQVSGGSLTLSDGLGHRVELACEELTGEQLSAGQLPSADAQAVAVMNSAGEIAERWVDIRALSGLFLRHLHDEANQIWYVSSALDTALIPAGARVPVLMYHAVGDETWGLEGLFMRPSELRAQLQFLTENGFDLLFFSDLARLSDFDKPVILTFDDGYTDNYTQLLPLLQEFKAKATVFVITNNMDYNSNFMEREQVLALAASGLVEIGSHTVSHGDLATLSASAQEAELRDSQLVLTRVTHRIPYVLSYPAGSYNADTLDIAPRFYDAAVKSRGDLWTVGGSFFEIDRFPVYRGVSVSTVQGMVEQGGQ